MNVEALPREVKTYISNLEAQWKQETQELLKKTEHVWQTKYNALEELYKFELYKKYGRSSEEYDPKQKLLFDEDECSETDSQSETETDQTITYTRKKKGRKPLNENLPREEKIIDISEDEKQCGCGNELSVIGQETSERLKIIPARIWVEKTIRPKYACKNCEGSGDEEKPAVRIAEPEPSIIPGSIASPSLLATVFVDKYADHLPFYRQEKRFGRIGVDISRQNMSNWQQLVYKSLAPLFEHMKQHLKKGPVMQMDETTVQVMKEEGRKDTQKSYMWLARGGPPGKPVVLYEYRRTRGSEHIHDFLEGFKGYLQTDGYKGYDAALQSHPDVIPVGCLAHARRKFHEASEVSKKVGSAEEALSQIRKIYRAEKRLRDKKVPREEFQAERKKQIQPLLDKLKNWLDKKASKVVTSFKLGKAVQYSRNQWQKIARYLECEHLTPDNNSGENAIRPFVMGRKNWLFSGSPKGAESSCGIYSIIETAKQNNLDPFEYMLYLFHQAPYAETTEDWEALLPWNLTNKTLHTFRVGLN